MEMSKELTQGNVSVMLHPEANGFAVLVRLPGTGSSGSHVTVEVFYKFGEAIEGVDVLRSFSSEFPCVPGAFCSGPVLGIHPDLVVLVRVGVTASHLAAGQIAQYRFEA